MTDHSSTAIPQPKNWQDFEQSCCILFECILNDPGIKANGTSGQSQQGVDIYGRPNGIGTNWVGIQCKKKKPNEKVTKSELRREVTEARKFIPPLSRFILVTTAPDDVTIDEEARLITQEHETSAVSFTVEVWGWDTLETKINAHQRALKAFHPDVTLFSEQITTNTTYLVNKADEHSGKLDLLTQTIQQLQNQLIPLGNDTSTVLEALDKNLHAEIDGYRDFITEGKPLTALHRLEKMRARVWESASDRIKFRLITNIGSAKLHIGKEREQEAIAHFLDAIRYQPEDKVALANIVLAHLLRDEPAEAITAARSALRLDNNNADVASYLIQAHIHDNSIHNPADLVPEHLRDTASVQIACINFYRSRQNSQWVQLAREAGKRYPDDKQIIRFVAEADLERAFSTQGLLVGEQPQASVSVEELHHAAHTLRNLWDKQVNSEIPAIDASLPYNLVLALKAIGDRAAAKAIAKQAIEIMPDASDLIKFHAGFCIEEGNTKAAITLLQKNKRDAASRLIIAEILADTDPIGVLETLEHFEEAEDAERHHPIAAASLRVGAWLAHPGLSQGDRINEAQREFHAIEAQFPDSLLVSIIHANIQHAKGNITEVQRLLHDAKLQLNPDSSFYDRLLLAKKNEELDNHSDVADILDGYVDPNRDTPALRMLLLALIHCDRRRCACDLLSSLPKQVAEKPLFLRAALSLHLRRGDYHGAECAADNLLNINPRDLHTHLNRTDIWLRQRNDDAVKQFLTTDVDQLDGLPEEFMRLAHLLDRYGFHERALKLGYKILLENRRQAGIQLSYMGLLIGQGSSEAVDLERPIISVDTAFSIKNAQDETETFVIEENEELRRTDEAIPLTHAFAYAATGLHVGGKFKVNNQEWEVTSVKHKYLHALHTKMEHFERHFPENGGLRRFIVKDGEGLTAIEPMLEEVKKRHDAIKYVFNVYDEQPLPLELFSDQLGTDVIEAWYGLAQTDHKFRVCDGNLAERLAAMSAIDTHGATGCVVDALTLHIIRVLGIEDAVAKVCGPIAATESTIDVFRFRREKILSYGGHERTTLFWRDGQFFREEVTEEQLAQMLAGIERELDWIEENVEILPAETAQIIPEEASRIKDDFSYAFLDPLLAAQQTGKLLLCEDHSYRQFGIGAFKVQATWLQPVLMSARENRIITQHQYSEAIYLLISAGHSFTSLDAGVLLHVARNENKHFRILAQALFGATADLKSHMQVMLEFCRSVWGRKQPSLNEQRATSLLLRRLCFGEWTQSHADINPYEILSWLSTRFSNRAFSKYLSQWQIGHIVPVLGYKQDTFSNKKSVDA